MNDSVRAFISVPVAEDVIRNIMRCQKELARTTGEAVRWAPQEQIHLTLQFLGNISPAEIERLQTRLAAIMNRSADSLSARGPAVLPFRLHAHGLGAFPSPSRPRVIWVGLAGQIDELKQLQAAVENATTQVGRGLRAEPSTVRKEEREFHPHLTIGRVREGHRSKLNVERWKDEPFGEWEARELLLMQSKLSPKGATHSVIARFEPCR